MNLASAEKATVEIVASHPRFAIPMYTGTKVHVEIDDGEASVFPWGQKSIAVTPGRHMVVVWSHGFNNTGAREWIWIEVAAGESAVVTYRASKFGGGNGTIESDNAVPEPDGPELSELSDAELVETWNEFKELAGRDPMKRFMLRKMRAEFEQEMRQRGLDPKSLGFRP